MTLHPVRTVLWQSHSVPGSEYFQLWQTEDGWQLRGTIIWAEGGVPGKVRYGITCGADWRTREVHLGLGAGSRERTLHLIVRDGEWRDRSGVLPHLAGCLDVDLEISPSTNSLPIRRLNLPIEDSGAARAAWVRFPELRVEPLEQRYTRLSEDLYHYQSDHGYETDMVVDDLGLIVTYTNMWTRAAAQDDD